MALSKNRAAILEVQRRLGMEVLLFPFKAIDPDHNLPSHNIFHITLFVLISNVIFRVMS
jgi:hypothetical protein